MSMTMNDILTLAKAGFTAQQISALNAVNAQPTQPTQPTQPAQPEQNDMFAQIMNQLKANAINQTEQPKVQTTDDILAEIINPPTNE